MKKHLVKNSKFIAAVLVSALLFSSCSTSVYTVNAVFKSKTLTDMTVEKDTTKYTYVKQTRKVLKDVDVYKTSKVKEIGYFFGEAFAEPVVCVTLEDGHAVCVPYSNGGECFNTSFAIGKTFTYKDIEKKYVDEHFYIKTVEKKDSAGCFVSSTDTLDDVFSDYVLGSVEFVKNVSLTNTFYIDGHKVVETKTVDTVENVDVTFPSGFFYHDTLTVFDVKYEINRDSSVVFDEAASLTDVKVFEKRVVTRNGESRYMLKLAKCVLCYDFTLTPMETYETFWVATDRETYENINVFNSNSNVEKWKHGSYLPSKYVYNLHGIYRSEINVKRIEK